MNLIFVQLLLSRFLMDVFWKLFSQLRREVLDDFEISEKVQREFAEMGDIWIQNKIL